MDINELIVFNLGEEEYGIDISYTKEIVRIPQITRMPSTPTFVEGIVNLRGCIIPIIDLKKKFGFVQSERSMDSRLLIIDFEGLDLGIIVDDVFEVVKVDSQAVEKLSAEIASMGGTSIEGIVKIDQRLILLLNACELRNEIFN